MRRVFQKEFNFTRHNRGMGLVSGRSWPEFARAGVVAEPWRSSTLSPCRMLISHWAYRIRKTPYCIEQC